MTTRLEYGLEKLYGAILSLTSAQSQKQRLETAIIVNLVPITPATELPTAIQVDFIAFMNEMQSHRTHDTEGAVWEVIQQLDDDAVDRAVSRIVGFYAAVNSSISLSAGSTTAIEVLDRSSALEGSTSRY